MKTNKLIIVGLVLSFIGAIVLAFSLLDSSKNIKDDLIVKMDRETGEYSQAKDDGEGNLWYEVISEEGNYWSNIGQNYTYMIDGSANSIDPYPLSVSPISIELPTLPIPPFINTEKTIFQFYPIYVISLLFVIYIFLKRKRFQYVD